MEFKLHFNHLCLDVSYLGLYIYEQIPVSLIMYSR